MHIRMLAACLLFSASLGAGQLLFKLAADDIRSKLSGPLINAFLSPWLISALFLYAASTCLWIWILSHTPLSKAYPFALIGAAIVPFLAATVLGEAITGKYIAGMVLILVGVLLTQSA